MRGLGQIFLQLVSLIGCQFPAFCPRSVVERGKVIGVTDHERRQVDLVRLVIVLRLLAVRGVALCGLRWHGQCCHRQWGQECCQVATQKQQTAYAETGDPPGPETSSPCSTAHRILLAAKSWTMVVALGLYNTQVASNRPA